MSLIVHRIGMPPCCDKCVAIDDDYGYPYCRAMRKIIEFTDITDKRADDCPLESIYNENEYITYGEILKTIMHEDNPLAIEADGRLFVWNAVDYIREKDGKMTGETLSDYYPLEVLAGKTFKIIERGFEE